MGDRLVLAYHALSPTWPAALSLAPDRLERQISLLAERGYRAARFTDIATGAACGRRLVAVTFDDGFASVIEHGLPILSRHGFVATVFVPTASIDRGGLADWPNVDRWLGGPHEHELRMMSWSDLRALASAGWEIGSHACTHPHLPSLDEQRLAEELATSRHTCERMLGIDCRSLAYPYGETDKRVMRAARASGYLAAAALPARIHRPDRFCWPRVGVWRGDPESLFETKLSRLRRRRLDLRTGKLRLLPRSRLVTL